MNFRRRRLVLCFSLALVSLATFHSVLGFSFVNFDDPRYVFDNPHVTTGIRWENIEWAFTTSYFNMWFPLTWISLMVDAQVFGLGPTGFHLTNLLLHTANVVLLFVVLDQCTQSFWRSAVVAGIFGLHPLRAEPVAWISSRKDVLSGMFLLLMLWAYARYARGRHWYQYLLVVSAFACGLMAKSMLVTVPILLLLLDYWPLSRCAASRSDRVLQEPDGCPNAATAAPWLYRLPWQKQGMLLIAEKLPMLLLSFAVSVGSYAVMRHGEGLTEADSVGWNRLAVACMTYLRYIEKLIWPVNLAPFYPRHGDAFSTVTLVIALAVLVGMSVVSILNAWRQPYLIVGWFWFLISLLPVIGLVEYGGHYMADRYMYVPSIGLIVMAVWSFADGAEKWRWPKSFVVVVPTAILITFGISSNFQVRHWRDSVALLQHTLEVTQNNDTAHTNLGFALLERGDAAGATHHFAEALRINSRYPEPWVGLGSALAGQGRFHEAMQYLKEAVRLRPNHADAQAALGTALVMTGNLEEGMEHFDVSLQIRPEKRSEVYVNLGVALATQGRYDEAIGFYRDAIRGNPAVRDGHYNLGCALFSSGRSNEAIQAFREALKTDPHANHVAISLAWILATDPDAKLRDGAEAVHFAKQAMNAMPQNAQASDALAAAYAELGQFEAAVQFANQAETLARDSNQSALAAAIQQRIQLYQAAQPFRNQ
jgi:tetratricopeptide (TPR) repeat protein